MTRRAVSPGDASELLALRSVGLTAGIPLSATRVAVLAPVVDTVGVGAESRGGLPPRVTAVIAFRKKLLRDLTERAQQLAALGLVSVRFAETPFVTQLESIGTVVQMTATALPVSATRPSSSRAFFRTSLAANDVVALVQSGWFPADIVTAGAVVSRDRRFRGQDMGSATNREMPGATDMIQQARHKVRDDLNAAARGLGADGVLISSQFPTVWSATMNLIEVSASGDAIIKWSDRRHPITTVLPLTC